MIQEPTLSASSKRFLAASQISKRYGTTNVLQDINLQIHAGEHVAVLGPSGCGKSTLLRLLSGLEPPSSGRIELTGEAVQAGTDHIGIMFQDALLYPWLSVKENVHYALGLKKGRHLPKQRVQDVLNIVGLAHAAHKRPGELSGGMKQRAALARMLVRHPDFLLLDEPFAALDAVTRLRLQSWLEKLAHDNHLTLVTITHDVDEALFLGDKVVLMAPHPGRIAHVWDVSARRPRDRNDPALLALRSEILDALFSVLDDENENADPNAA